MACYYPLQGWRGRVRTRTGKRPIVFNPAAGFSDMAVAVPCGQCIGCRLEYARGWAVRCMFEASQWAENSFITLTYDEKFVPRYGALDKSAFPKFMKRLRKDLDGRRVRYFHCGEYGEESKRPHYHSLLFGYDFPDKTHWATRNGLPVWRSERLEKLWPFGNSEIGTVTFESASYVARYVTKKVTGDSSWRHYAEVDADSGEVVERPREYTTMSRRPGIGMSWIYRYLSDVYPKDNVVVRGHEVRPPRAYDLYLERTLPSVHKQLLKEREERRVEGEDSFERLRAREAVARAKVNLNRGL